MLETMYGADGVGLAATQVDVHERVIVIDTSEARDDPRVLINPELVDTSEEVMLAEEGLPVGARRSTTRWRATRGCACARSTATASRTSSTPKACSRSASSTRWIT